MASERARLEAIVVKAVAKRDAARAKKKFGLADELRDALARMGVNVQDTPDGSSSWKWTKKALLDFAEAEPDGDDDDAPAAAEAAPTQKTKPEKMKKRVAAVDLELAEDLGAVPAKKQKTKNKEAEAKPPADDDDNSSSSPREEEAEEAAAAAASAKKKEEEKTKTKKKKKKKKKPEAEEDGAKAKANATASKKQQLRGGVVAETLKAGTGAVARMKSKIKVQYVGTLAKNGRRFDAGSIDFRLGAGDVIQGWDVGCAGMRVGEKRRLHIPAKMGYGKRGSPPDIPPNAALNFDVTLLKA